MIHLITYCTDNYTRSANVVCQSAMKHGVDTVKIARDYDIPATVKLMFGDNLKEVNRHWFYIWKPYIIWNFIQGIQDGEIVIYADAGQTFTDSIKPLIDKMDEDILLFHNPWRHVEWCKADVSGNINGVQFAEYLTFRQAQASLIFFRITPEVRNFVKEWMLWCMMPGFCDNSPSHFPNYSTFQEHRYDQAVLTCLQIKYGYKLHQFPSIDNGGAPYRMTNHHRKNNQQW